MNYKKQATDFKRKYNIKVISSKSLIRALNEQGYTVIDFNGIVDVEDVAALRDALDIGQYMKQSRCFTYRDDKYRLVFINDSLNEDEKQIALAHEEGHIWNDHLTKDSIIGNDVIQEHQANEFAHYLLKDKSGKIQRTRNIAIISLIVILICILAGICIKIKHDEAVYTEDLYRTESGAKYHKRNCMYLENRNDVYRLTREEFESGMYEPCEACKPDKR